VDFLNFSLCCAWKTALPAQALWWISATKAGGPAGATSKRRRAAAQNVV